MSHERTHVMRELLLEGRSDWWLRVHDRSIVSLCEGYDAATAASLVRRTGLSANQQDFVATLAHLLQRMREHQLGITHLRALRHEHETRYAHAPVGMVREHSVLRYAEDLGVSALQLAGDRHALKRDFDLDAVHDRWSWRVGESTQLLCVGLDLIAGLIANWAPPPGAMRYELLWARLHLESQWLFYLRYADEERVREAAIAGLLRILQRPMIRMSSPFGTRTHGWLSQYLLEREGSVWVQASALQALRYFDAEAAAAAWSERLRAPGADDDLFVRARLVQAVGAWPQCPRREELLALGVRDASPHVRQTAAAALPSPPTADSLWSQLLNDAEPSVRGGALLALVGHAGRAAESVTAALQTVLAQEADAWCLRLAIKLAADLIESAPNEVQRLRYAQAFDPELSRLHATAATPALRRWAAAARLRVGVALDAELRTLRAQLQPRWAVLRTGRFLALGRHRLATLDDDRLARLLASLALADFPVSLYREFGYESLRRGDRFGFRLWRFLHELRISAADKRQAFRHTIARHLDAPWQAPSDILCEQSETKVPGEPLAISEEQGWRPFLPLLDHFISALNPFGLGRVLRLATPDGITTVEPPRGWRARLRAWWKLSWRYAAYAALRNWTLRSARTPQAYLEALHALGFTTVFRPYADSAQQVASCDPDVRAFWPQALVDGVKS